MNLRFRSILCILAVVAGTGIAIAQSDQRGAGSSVGGTAGIDAPARTTSSVGVNRAGAADSTLAGGAGFNPTGNRITFCQLYPNSSSCGGGGTNNPPPVAPVARWLCVTEGEVGNYCRWNSWAEAPLCERPGQSHRNRNYGGYYTSGNFPPEQGQLQCPERMICDPVGAYCSTTPTMQSEP